MHHKVDHGNENHTFTAARRCLVVFGESAVLTEPTERALDDSAFGQHHKFANHLLGNNLNDAALAAARIDPRAATLLRFGNPSIRQF